MHNIVIKCKCNIVKCKYTYFNSNQSPPSLSLDSSRYYILSFAFFIDLVAEIGAKGDDLSLLGLKYYVCYLLGGFCYYCYYYFIVRLG